MQTAQAFLEGLTASPRLSKAQSRRQALENQIEALLASAESLIAILDRQDGDVEDWESELDEDVTDQPHDEDSDREPEEAA